MTSSHSPSVAPSVADMATEPFNREATEFLTRCLAISEFGAAREALLEGADPATPVILSRGAPATSPLHIAAGRLRFEENEATSLFNQQALALISELIARGAPINALCPSRRSPLCQAAMSNRPDRAALLLQAGADPNGADIEGLRPLDYAAISDNAQLALDLITAGADPSLCFKLDPASIYLPLIKRSSVPGLCEAWRESRELGLSLEASSVSGRPRPL